MTRNKSHSLFMLQIRSFAVGALCFCAASVALAQTNTADIVGTVTDTTGAVVANATVTAINTGTGQTRTAPTNAVGDYSFSLLQIGTYSVKMEAPGFKQYSVPNVTIAAGDRVRVDAQLQTGGASETVTVTSVSPALQTDNSTVGTLVQNAQVQDLPLNGRNFINLVTVQVGVTPGLGGAFASGVKPDDRRMTSSYSANGQTDQANNNLIDGFDNNDRLIGTIGVRPSPDAIEQVKIGTGLYTADVGRSAGGVVDIITKSGSNAIHGSVYEYFRNDIFDASNYFTPAGKKTELRQNQYGFSLGGPIRKDKTFFFGDYEGFRLVNGMVKISTVPTAFEQANCNKTSGCNFTDLKPVDSQKRQAANPSLPYPDSYYLVPASRVTDIGLSYFHMYPLPTSSALFNNYVRMANSTQNSHLADVRVDHHFTDKTSFYSRYSYNHVYTWLPGQFPNVNLGGGSSAVNDVQPGSGTYGFAGPSTGVQQHVGLTITHIFRANLLGELKAGYLRNDIATLSANAGKASAAAINYQGVNVGGLPQTDGLPSFIVGNGFTGLGDAAFQPEYELDNSFQYAGSLVYSPSNHIIKIGGGLIRRQAKNDQSIFPRGAGFMVGAAAKNILGIPRADAPQAPPLEDMVMGEAESIFRQTGLIAPHFRTWEPSVYFQDDWRVTNALTLNLGVRYDVFTPYTAANQAFSNFNFSKNLIVGPALPGANHSSDTGGVETFYGNIAPRIGFALNLGNNTVLRGGFGMSYFPGNFTLQSFMKNPPYADSFECGFVNPPTALPCYQVDKTYAGSSPPFGPSGPAGGGVNYKLGAQPVPVFDMTKATNPANYVGKLFYAMDSHFKPTYVEQYSLQLQKDFAGNVATIGYVGNLGRHLVGYPNLNQTPYPGAPNPIAGMPASTIISTGVSAGVSNYNALQMSVERRFLKGLFGNVNYTYAHALANISTNGESFSNIPNGNRFNCIGLCHVNIPGTSNYRIVNGWQVYDYGHSELDVRHRFAITTGYALPFGRTLTGAAAFFLKDWSTNLLYYYQTGLPFTVENTQNAASVGGTYDGFTNNPDRPNLVGDPVPTNRSVTNYLNKAAFAVQATNTLGNEGKNAIRAPGATALNFSLVKLFPIYENLNLQFRMESFNLFNTPTFNPPDNGFGNPQFGVISSTVPGSPPRQFQFAAKFLF